MSSTTKQSNFALYSAQQSQAIDQFARQNGEIPGILLMKRAAFFSWKYLYAAIRHYQIQKNPRKVWVLCGTGNNGGDGLMLAQYAKLAGEQVTVWLHGEPNHIKNDAKLAFEEWFAIRGTTRKLGTLKKFQKAFVNQPHPPILIDALFGTGLNRPIDGALAEIIQWLNQQHKPLFALDIPSGLCANSGNILGCALKASATLTFLTQKIGFYTQQGPDTCGTIYFDDLQLLQACPNAYESQPPIAHTHSLPYWLQYLPKRSSNSHKGISGTTLFMGGNHSMSGAIQLAAMAALRTGSGLCKVVTRKRHHASISALQPEIMCFKRQEMKPLLTSSRAIVIGPGLGQDTWAKKIWQGCLKAFTSAIQRASQSQPLPLSTNLPPLILDADALNWLAGENDANLALWKRLPKILTPHPGEAARLLKVTTEHIQTDRVAAIKALHKRYGGIIVLKGNGSLIFDGKNLELCRAGNPGMATGGMGDVLSGTIAGFLAQNLTPYKAACLGVWLHSCAADSLINTKQRTYETLLPCDLADIYSSLLNR